MARTTIRYNSGAFEAIRRSPEVDALLTQTAEKIRAACGAGYETDGATPGESRSRAGVWTQTPEAMMDNAANNTLVNSLDQGRV